MFPTGPDPSMTTIPGHVKYCWISNPSAKHPMQYISICFPSNVAYPPLKNILIVTLKLGR